MRTNKLVWGGLGVFVFAAMVVVINKANEPDSTRVVENRKSAAAEKQQSHLKVQPNKIDGDTVVDTLAEVQAKYDAKDAQIQKLVEQNRQLLDRMGAIERQTGTAKGDTRIDQVMQQINNMGKSVEQLSGQFQVTTKQLATTHANGYAFSGDSLGWGDVGGATATGSSASGYSSVQKNGADTQQPTTVGRLAGYVSITPMISHFEDTEKTLDARFNEAGLSKAKAVPEDEVTPVYTIPARSTLLDNVAMTALIGRVPRDGKLKSPFPAKIIVGDNNLATNGIKIPGLKGIVFEGIASGNWNLSCVSVHLTAATFTFQDGRVQHLAADVGQGKKNQTAALSPITGESFQNSIGYISNTQGVPCISGNRKTDVPKQIAAFSALGAASKWFDAKAQQEVTTGFDGGGAVSAVTGDDMKYAGNSLASGLIDGGVKAYQNLNRDTFDAVVTPPGEAVVIHITQDLLIDYHSAARKIVYGSSDLNGGRNETSLD